MVKVSLYLIRPCKQTTCAFNMEFALRLYTLCARRPPIYVELLQQRRLKRAIKAFQNLQLTEHHIDSLQQSAAGAGGNERWGGRCERRSQIQLASSLGAALLRHGSPHIPWPYHRADSMLVSIRVSQLPEARVRRAFVHVQRTVLRRSCSHCGGNGRIFSSSCGRSTAFLSKYCKYYLCNYN